MADEEDETKFSLSNNNLRTTVDGFLEDYKKNTGREERRKVIENACAALEGAAGTENVEYVALYKVSGYSHASSRNSSAEPLSRWYRRGCRTKRGPKRIRIRIRRVPLCWVVFEASICGTEKTLRRSERPAWRGERLRAEPH